MRPVPADGGERHREPLPPRTRRHTHLDVPCALAGPSHGRRRSQEFEIQRDALDFGAKLRLAKPQGALSELDGGRESLAEFVEEWWQT